jgi:hypothetical protein
MQKKRLKWRSASMLRPVYLYWTIYQLFLSVLGHSLAAELIVRSNAVMFLQEPRRRRAEDEITESIAPIVENLQLSLSHSLDDIDHFRIVAFLYDLFDLIILENRSLLSCVYEKIDLFTSHRTNSLSAVLGIEVRDANIF